MATPSRPQSVSASRKVSATTSAESSLVAEILSAEADFERIRAAGLEQIRFGWAGNLEPRRPQYYRLQGPTFLLEFDNSRNGGTHIHSVWRDFQRDFGQSLG